MRAHLPVPSTPGAAAPDVDDIQHDDPVLRAITVLGAIAGVTLVTDTVTITAINSSFDPLDSILFFIGFGAIPLVIASIKGWLGVRADARTQAKAATSR